MIFCYSAPWNAVDIVACTIHFLVHLLTHTHSISFRRKPKHTFYHLWLSISSPNYCIMNTHCCHHYVSLVTFLDLQTPLTITDISDSFITCHLHLHHLYSTFLMQKVGSCFYHSKSRMQLQARVIRDCTGCRKYCLFMVVSCLLFTEDLLQ